MDNAISNKRELIDIAYHQTLEDMQMKTHFHNSHEIIFILEGRVQFTINDRMYMCGPGNMIFISNLESHELKVDEYPYRRYFLLINPEFFQQLSFSPILASILKNRPDHFNHVLKLDESEMDEFIRILDGMHGEISITQPFCNEYMAAQLQLLLVLLYRRHKEAFPVLALNKSMSIVFEVQKFIEKHYMEEISLKEISRSYYRDMYYLSHLFKKITGYTFKEYVILQRISKARELLFSTELNITKVGLESGFNNVNHFIRIFKKFEGITPYQYRKLTK